MSNPFRNPYTVTQPPFGTGIDWKHPLSNGLVGCWLSNGGHNRTMNLVDGRGATADTSGRLIGVSAAAPDGRAILAAANVLYDTSSYFTNLSNAQGTVVFKAVLPINPGNSDVSGHFFWGSYDTTLTNQLILVYDGTSPNVFLHSGWYFNGVGDYRVAATVNNTVLPQNFANTLVTTWDTAVGTYLYNMPGSGTSAGQLITLGSNLTPPVIGSAINSGGFGVMGVKFLSSASTNSNNTVTKWFLTYVYNRVLSQAEIRMVTAEPYCFFQPPRKLWTRTPDIVRSGIVLGV